MRRDITRHFSSIVKGCFWIGLLVVYTISAAAQNTRNTDYSPDKSLKSNARINPSTLAMELSVPLGGYAGRAGNSQPVVFSYSSKIWEIQAMHSFPHVTLGLVTNTQPVYAKRTAAGWSSSLGSPRIGYESSVYQGSDNPATQEPPGYVGQVHSFFTPGEGGEPLTYGLYSVKRMHITMPDGSSHEFRADDAIVLCGDTGGNNCPSYTAGTYLSVDGSKMRLEMNSSGTARLYLSDGGYYDFEAYNPAVDVNGHQARKFTDAHGNRMTYDVSNRRWTDTMGRVIVDPMPINKGSTQNQTVGDFPATLPGFDGGTIGATFSWQYLKNPSTGESALNDPDQTLSYTSSIHCINNGVQTVSGTYLFTAGLTLQTRVCSSTSLFNPIVLTKITLANGQSYQFKYNLHGEIEKIIYPTGAYERFAYAYIPPVQISDASYDQTNRGVTDRWVSEKGDGTDEMHWNYTAARGTSLNPAPYKITTVNPDGTRAEQLLYDEPNPNVQRPYGFSNAKTGRSYDDKVFSSTNQLMRRNLTKYVTSGPLSGGYTGATRDMRPEKQISITFEPGESHALAQLSETVYDTSGNSDPAYFSALNAKETKVYKYKVISLSAATDSSVNAIDTIAALFSSSDLETVTEIYYLYDANYKARNITGLATETRIKDAAGAVKAKTEISYDESVYSLSSTGTMPTAAANSWIDLTGSGEFGTSVGSKRGLPTTVKSYSDIANNQYIQTHSYYDQYGNVRKTKDGNNESEIQYSADYAFAYPTKTISAIPDQSGTKGSDEAFETTVVYDYNTGLPTSTTDANGQTTTMSYADPTTGVVDPLLRIRKVTAPNNHQTITEYGAGTSVSTRFIKSRTQIDANNWKEGYSWFDGLGRAIKSQSVDSNGDVFVNTEYDQFGRLWKTTNPYRTGEIIYKTENFYDTAGRLYKVKSSDNAEVETFFSLATTGANIGTVVTVEDQANKQRRSITNALGQLTRVDEPDVNNSNQLGAIDAPNQPTYYEYDSLSNLTKVKQGGTFSTPEQTRTFVYDSLSRLKSATNPESGTIQYQYDNNGNLTHKTDAREVETIYTYDALNRVVTKSYDGEPSGIETPAVTYTYDNLTNAKGKLIKVENDYSTTEYTEFDILGRVMKSRQTTEGTARNMEYVYNLSGAMVEQKYPSGRVVKNVLDNDGELSIVQSKKNQTAGYWDYAKNFTFTAAGAVSSMQLGNGKWESTVFNSRLQPTTIALGTVQGGTDKLNLVFGYGTTQNNGNVLSQTIEVPTIGSNQGFTAVQTYTYDSLNRLKSATEIIDSGSTPSWKQTFTFDRYGNRNFDEANTTTLPKNCTESSDPAVCAADRKVFNPEILTSNNRLKTDQDGDSQDDYLFDTSGNTTKDANGRTFVYDAENKQILVKDSSGNKIGEYFYDGDGRRVKKVEFDQYGTPTQTTIFVYDASSKLVAEYATNVEPVSTARVSYLTNDHLGSPRITTDKDGRVFSRRDFMPFGEEIDSTVTLQRGVNLNYGEDGIRQKFTSYERDNEIGLDFAQARYHNYNLGRFNSPDPLIITQRRLVDPQAINLYVYVRNNPLAYIDPNGTEFIGKDNKRVIIGEDEDGNITYSDNATQDLIDLINLINQSGSKKAKKQFDALDKLQTRVHLKIVKEPTLKQGANGETEGQWRAGKFRPHNENGDEMEWDSVNGKFIGGDVAYIKDKEGNNTDEYEEATITLFEGNIKPPYLDGLQLGAKDSNLTVAEQMVITFTHESDHGTNRKAINAIRKGGKYNVFKKVEKPAYKLEKQVLKELQKIRRNN